MSDIITDGEKLMKEKTMCQRVCEKEGISMDKATPDHERYPEWVVRCDCIACTRRRKENKMDRRG